MIWTLAGFVFPTTIASLIVWYAIGVRRANSRDEAYRAEQRLYEGTLADGLDGWAWEGDWPLCPPSLIRFGHTRWLYRKPRPMQGMPEWGSFKFGLQSGGLDMGFGEWSCKVPDA